MTYNEIEPVPADVLMGLLDPITAWENRLVPLSFLDGQVELGTDGRDAESWAWLPDYVGHPVQVRQIGTTEWEAHFDFLYGDACTNFAAVTTPVTDVLKRVILVSDDTLGDEDLQRVLAPVKEQEGFELVVTTVGDAMELLTQATTAHRDLVLLSERVTDFFEAKFQLEEKARNTTNVQLQVIGTQSARKQPTLVADYFRRAA